MQFAGPGQYPLLKGLPTNEIALPAGGTYILWPAGWYAIRVGKYSTIQQYDPITGAWRRVGGGVMAGGIEYFYSDGFNYRIANQTGCAVGALLTNAGSGYTSAPTVTASAGSSIWKSILGGAVSTTVTISNSGQNYTYPPIVQFSAPAYLSGIQATGYATISGGVVTGVTVTNQGAGYTSAPLVTFINDPRENPNIQIAGSTVTQGSGASAVATLTGANTVTGLLCLDHGTPLTSVPTLSFSGGGGSSAAATAIMDWTITGATVGTAGAGLSGAAAWITAEDAFPTTAAAYTNPDSQANLVQIRKADIRALVSAGALSGTPVVYDGGIYTSAPTPLVLANASVVTTAPVVTVAMGGVPDTSYIMQF